MSFDVAAEAYDAFMGRYSSPLAEAFVAWAGLPAAGTALDVGCGPGAMLSVLAKRYGEDRMAGVDPSQSFVAAAAARHPLADVRQGDVEHLPFADDTFDAAVAALVMHFVADPVNGLAEMRRVTRPGGIVGATVWDFGGHREPHTPFYRGLAEVVGHIDDQSDRPGASSGQLGRMLRATGCADVEETELTVRRLSATFEEWWEPYTRGVSVAGSQLAALTPDDRERVREACRADLGDGPVEIVATAWAVRGTA